MNELDFLLIIALFIAVSIIFTYILKKKTGFETYFILTLIKTERPLGLLRRLSEKAGFMEKASEIFVVLGFGALAADFLYGKDKSPLKRAMIFVISFTLLSAVMLFIDFFFSGVFSRGPMTKDAFSLLVFVFGISGFAGFVMLSLAIQAADIIIKLIAGKVACPGVAPLLPGVQLPNVPLVIPLHAWLSLFIILIIHEGMHGIIALRHRFQIKSTGIVLFGFLPVAAFVEPDETDLIKKEKTEPRAALRFLAAGPGANLLAMPIVFVITLLVALPMAAVLNPWNAQIRAEHPSQIFVLSVDKNVSFCGDVYPSPAYGLLDSNWQILKVNGKDINSLGVLQYELSQTRYKDVIFTVKKLDGNISIVTLKPNELGTLGFSVTAKVKDSDKIPQDYLLANSAASTLLDFLFWLLLLNFIAAISNFLPSAPFDGGRMAKIIFAPYCPIGRTIDEKRNLVGRFFVAWTVIILFLNIIPLFQ